MVAASTHGSTQGEISLGWLIVVAVNVVLVASVAPTAGSVADPNRLALSGDPADSVPGSRPARKARRLEVREPCDIIRLRYRAADGSIIGHTTTGVR